MTQPDLDNPRSLQRRALIVDPCADVVTSLKPCIAEIGDHSVVELDFSDSPPELPLDAGLSAQATVSE